MRSRVVLGVADQLVSSGSNYLCAFVASLVLAPEAFGAFVAAFAVVTILSATARSLVGDPLITALPGVAEHRRVGIGAAAIGTAVLAGVAGAAICVAAALLLGGAIGAALLVLAGWVPAAVAVDACRYVLLARSDTRATLVVDTVWAAAQGVVLVVLLLAGTWTVAGVAASWGVGALVALAVGIALVPEARAAGLARPAAWLRESRGLTGWFTLTSVLGQAQGYLVLLLAGVALSTVDVAGLRAVQLLVFQPPITFMGALLVLAVPIVARHHAVGDVQGVRRTRRTGMVAMGVLAGVLLLAVPLREPLLGLLFPRYLEAAALVLPIVLQTAIAGFSVPLQAEVRGTRRGGALFGLQLVSAVAVLGGAALGMTLGRAEGLAWGLAASSAVTLIVFLAAARTTAPAPPSRLAEPATVTR